MMVLEIFVSCLFLIGETFSAHPLVSFIISIIYDIVMLSKIINGVKMIRIRTICF